MPHRHREGIRINPKIYSFGILEKDEPEFILIPNAPKTNHESLMEIRRMKKIRKLDYILLDIIYIKTK